MTIKSACSALTYGLRWALTRDQINVHKESQFANNAYALNVRNQNYSVD